MSNFRHIMQCQISSHYHMLWFVRWFRKNNFKRKWQTLLKALVQRTTCELTVHISLLPFETKLLIHSCLRVSMDMFVITQNCSLHSIMYYVYCMFTSSFWESVYVQMHALLSIQLYWTKAFEHLNEASSLVK